MPRAVTGAARFEDSPGPNRDPVRIIDRFFLGEPQIRGFDIRGVGPRVQRFRVDDNGVALEGKENLLADNALGGRAYYLARAEVEISRAFDARTLPPDACQRRMASTSA